MIGNNIYITMVNDFTRIPIITFYLSIILFTFLQIPTILEVIIFYYYPSMNYYEIAFWHFPNIRIILKSFPNSLIDLYIKSMLDNICISIIVIEIIIIPFLFLLCVKGFIGFFCLFPYIICQKLELELEPNLNVNLEYQV